MPWNKGELVKVTCEVCGTVRKMWPAHAKNTRACSPECGHELKRRVTGTEHPLFRRKLISCRFCGTEFFVKPSELARKFYCSRACVGSASVRKQGGRQSSLEVAVAAHLDALGVRYQPQVRVHRFLVDFRIGDLIVEADGIYWHSQPKVQERDARKNAAVAAAGYRMLRLTEAEILAGDFSRLDAALSEAAAS